MHVGALRVPACSCLWLHVFGCVCVTMYGTAGYTLSNFLHSLYACDPHVRLFPAASVPIGHIRILVSNLLCRRHRASFRRRCLDCAQGDSRAGVHQVSTGGGECCLLLVVPLSACGLPCSCSATAHDSRPPFEHADVLAHSLYLSHSLSVSVAPSPSLLLCAALWDRRRWLFPRVHVHRWQHARHLHAARQG